MTTPAALTSDDIPPGPLSEDDLRQGWNAQADEFNQWDSLDTSEQLAWAQARAIAADRARTALKAEPEGEGPSAADLLPVEPPNIPTTMAMQYRSAWREGVEDGWSEARAVLGRRGGASAAAPEPGENPATPLAPQAGALTDIQLWELLPKRLEQNLLAMVQLAAPHHNLKPIDLLQDIAPDFVDYARAVLASDRARRIARWGRPATPPAPEPQTPPTDDAWWRELVNEIARVQQVAAREGQLGGIDLAKAVELWCRPATPPAPQAREVEA
jgi:hypothetical protein